MSSLQVSKLLAQLARALKALGRGLLPASELGPRVLVYLRRYRDNEAQHLFALTLAVGGLCGVLAVLFHLSIRAAESLLIERALQKPGISGAIWTIATPTMGGLLAGLLLAYVIPNARGSGIPQVKQAFAIGGGRIRLRDVIGKFFVSTLQIGSGASLGREGPTVHICAGAASALARFTPLSPQSVRRLTPVGVAAGIAAAFNAPIAAVTFTIEEIVGTLDQAVLSGVVVAAALAAVIERGILGVHPVIEVPRAYELSHLTSLPFYALLGLASGAVSILFTDGLLGLRLRFRKFKRLPLWSQPALGGLATGILALLVMRTLGTTGVTGGGYETLSRALLGEIGVTSLLILCLAKGLATVASYSSGGAGGIFAPTLFIGAMLGGAVGHLDIAATGADAADAGAFALVGMGAVFAGVIRAPITSVLIIFEMTGGYGLVLPLMLANTTAYVIARQLRPTPIYEALLEQDGIHLKREATTSIEQEPVYVRDAMSFNVVAATEHALVAEVIATTGADDFAILPVVDAQRQLKGVLTVSELRDADPEARIDVLLKRANLIHTYDPLPRALGMMKDLAVNELVVVDETGNFLSGVLALEDALRCEARALRRRALQEATTTPGAAALMHSIKLVNGRVGIPELWSSAPPRLPFAFVVCDEQGQSKALLSASLAAHHSQWNALTLDDVAQPVESVPKQAGQAELAELLYNRGFELAAVVEESGQPSGVVTRQALASALLSSYATRLRSKAPGRA